MHIVKPLRENELFKFYNGDCLKILKSFESESIDCIITSPPYWRMRKYDNSQNIHEIGNEKNFNCYMNALALIFTECKRVLKNSGSFWLNLGDKYSNKMLLGLPWRIAISLMDSGWIMRNDVIWNQLKGTQSCRDRLRDSYEHFFHFVKKKYYFYDDMAIRIKPVKKPTISKTTTISSTGVSGKKYRKMIIESTALNENEKINAFNALESALQNIQDGLITDFRMTIRGAQRVWHGNDSSISGRAKELETHGYYIIKINTCGHIPSDIWNIVPEDTWRKDNHCAVFPEELLQIPLLATCPKCGIVLDPFSGTGTTVAAAVKLKRRGIGIDLSPEYIIQSINRVKNIQQDLI